MRRPLASLVALAATAAGLTLVVPESASAAPTCTFRPVLPKRVIVGQSVVGLRVPLAIAGPSGCRANPIVSAQLVHGRDSYFLAWTDTQPNVESVYANSIVPGTYRTTAEDCSAYDADFNELSCVTKPASTVIKYANRSRISAARKGYRVTLHARSARYDDLNGTKGTTARIAIQYLTRKGWVTIRRATSSAAKGYTWSFTHRTRARYRVAVSEVGSTFAGASRSVVK